MQQHPCAHRCPCLYFQIQTWCTTSAGHGEMHCGISSRPHVWCHGQRTKKMEHSWQLATLEFGTIVVQGSMTKHCFRVNGGSHLTEPLGMNRALPQSLLQFYLIKCCSFGRHDRHQFRNAAFLGLTSRKAEKKKELHKKNISSLLSPSSRRSCQSVCRVLWQQQLSFEAAVQIHDGSVQTAVVIVHNSQQRVKSALLFLTVILHADDELAHLINFFRPLSASSVDVTFPACGVEEGASNHRGLSICLLFSEMDGCKRGDVMRFLCQIQSSLFSTCRTISEVGVGKGGYFLFSCGS